MTSLIVTGASSGIGLAIARRFMAEGWRVINLSRRPCPEPQVEHLSADLQDPECLERALAGLAGRFAQGSQFCLVHNAARLEPDRIDDLPDAKLRSVIELNLLAPNRINQALIPLMGAGSSILYIGSTLAEKAVPGTASYTIAKHALVGMMRATCQDLAGRRIHTCMLCPGFTDTPQLRALLGDDPERLRAIAAMNAFGRLVAPEEIAELAWVAAHSPVLNGALIHANLGQSER
ncbi:SDR family oxidoreductase [Caldichromatium japonicum]|uniref:SDR family oxidoreductase n=1 Tax=Caldichromatium japonicum TaxID=2699430 RepID=A0A6G7VCE5_9GAMM|nr:SDR family oxidoreductase [Caldichromatium japonicum]QIK37729.1 SDR family oxidoreductase [Caldichromatium japonicum]